MFNTIHTYNNLHICISYTKKLIKGEHQLTLQYPGHTTFIYCCFMYKLYYVLGINNYLEVYVMLLCCYYINMNMFNVTTSC